jgi:uroporphyrinogen III methyltransferase / synthase
MAIEGRRVLLTRARGENTTLARMLREAGAGTVEIPTIEIRPPESWTRPDQVLTSGTTYDWVVFTSAHGVDAFRSRYPNHPLPQVAVVGPRTAARARALGIEVALVPGDYRVGGLLDALPVELTEQRFLLPRGDLADRTLTDALRARGARVDEVVIYRTVVPEAGRERLLEELDDGRIDCVTFTSGSTVRNLASMLGSADAQRGLGGTKIAVIGPVTRKAVESLGWRVAIEPDEATVEALGGAVIDYFR